MSSKNDEGFTPEFKAEVARERAIKHNKDFMEARKRIQREKDYGKRDRDEGQPG